VRTIAFENWSIFLKKFLIPKLVFLNTLLLNNNENRGNSHIALTIVGTYGSQKK
jgi:hypothetical protein